MIKLLRVDHRLLHGQVAMAWTQSLDSDCILIANDAVVNDNIRKVAVRLPMSCSPAKVWDYRQTH